MGPRTSQVSNPPRDVRSRLFRFDRAVNLNTWLLNEGLLKWKDPNGREEGELFPNVDWSRTQAYAIGLNAIYVNLSGRERNGIVPKNAAAGLIEQIAARLKAFRDPDKPAAVVTATWAPHPRFDGDIEYAPDLIVGFSPGYRSSWGGALGSVSSALIEDNRDAWIGDHCIDARHVPGMLLGSRKSNVADPDLKDLPVSILGLFGVARSGAGRDIYH